MAEESKPATAEETVKSVPAPVENAQPAAKPMTAAEFVAVDHDRPVADDENPDYNEDHVGHSPFGLGNVGVVGPAPESAESKRGRKRSANPSKDALRQRERYARLKAERAAVPPPSFSDLPGGSTGGAPQANATASPTQAGAPMPPPVNYRANAEGLTLMLNQMLVSTSGPQWEFKSNEQKESIVVPFAEYMRIHQWNDFSPGFALVLAVGAYAIPAVMDKRTQEQLKKIAAKLRGEEEKKKTETNPQTQEENEDVPGLVEFV